MQVKVQIDINFFLKKITPHACNKYWKRDCGVGSTGVPRYLGTARYRGPRDRGDRHCGGADHDVRLGRLGRQRSVRQRHLTVRKRFFSHLHASVACWCFIATVTNGHGVAVAFSQVQASLVACRSNGRAVGGQDRTSSRVFGCRGFQTHQGAI